MAMDNKIPKTYKIGQIKVEGAITEPLAVVVRSGLAQGDNIKIPGEQLGNAIKKLWDTGLFTDVQILIDEDIQVIIEDNGIGFAVEKAMKGTGMGLKNIHQRVKNRNGVVHISSTKGNTTIIINIPLNEN